MKKFGCLFLGILFMIGCDLTWTFENEDYETLVEPINYEYNWYTHGFSSISEQDTVYFQKFVYDVRVGKNKLIYITSSTLEDSVRLNLGFYLLKDSIQVMKTGDDSTGRYCSFSTLTTEGNIVYHRRSVYLQVTQIDRDICGTVEGRLVGPDNKQKYLKGNFRFKNIY